MQRELQRRRRSRGNRGGSNLCVRRGTGAEFGQDALHRAVAVALVDPAPSSHDRAGRHIVGELRECCRRSDVGDAPDQVILLLVPYQPVCQPQGNGINTVDRSGRQRNVQARLAGRAGK